MKGNRIKLLREEKKIKQEELAKILSLSSSAIGMYERDEREPNDDITIKLAEYFNVSTDYLLGKSDVRNIDLKEIKIAQHNGIDTNGLNDEDLEEIKRQVEYMRWKRNNKK